MEVTTEMISAAISEAVRQKILPKYGPMEIYEDTWTKMELVLNAALNEAPYIHNSEK